jgi:hypothetical protein
VGWHVERNWREIAAADCCAKQTEKSGIFTTTKKHIAIFPELFDCCEVTDLTLSFGEMDEETEEKFGRLLEENRLTALCISKSIFSSELCCVLSSHWSYMTSLVKLELDDITIRDQVEFNKLLLGLARLRLIECGLMDLELTDENCIALCRVLPQLKKLRGFNIIRLGFTCNMIDANFITESSPHAKETQTTLGFKGRALRLQRLMQSISKCKKLKKLMLIMMNIGDEMRKELCNMIDSLGNLRELSLLANELSSDGSSYLAKFLQEKRRRLEMLYMGFDETPKEEDLKKLQPFCNVVLH